MIATLHIFMEGEKGEYQYRSYTNNVRVAYTYISYENATLKTAEL